MFANFFSAAALFALVSSIHARPIFPTQGLTSPANDSGGVHHSGHAMVTWAHSPAAYGTIRRNPTPTGLRGVPVPSVHVGGAVPVSSVHVGAAFPAASTSVRPAVPVATFPAGEAYAPSFQTEEADPVEKASDSLGLGGLGGTANGLVGGATGLVGSLLDTVLGLLGGLGL